MQQAGSAVLGAIKGQGMSWFKNIKDRTAAVAQTVQSTYGTRGPDVTFITSRLIIAPLVDGIPEALAAQAEETMRAHVMDQARGQFATFNLSNRFVCRAFCYQVLCTKILNGIGTLFIWV
ncbi:unnamed protein product [Gongylonema pulchrum]|uniref:PHB domain-containing protein n=1 Tax=Gongylonema pulchrum TaxID=637853 RepID=A0A183DL87_9BILA|nr:unnamed protein product [Gongylonema pulchrum]